MNEPDPKEVLREYEAMRRRHDAAEALNALNLEEGNRYWEQQSPLERRIGWRAAGCPRFLYKYRGPVDSDEGARRAADLLLRHQLWLADASKYEDPQDSRIDYRITLSGEALRSEMASYMRRMTRSSRFQAERMLSDSTISDPSALMAYMNANAELILRRWGICSLAANARSERMWWEYSQRHQGLCFQFHPAADLRAFVLTQPITYSDEERVIENRLFGDELIRRRLDLLNTKRTKYSFEDEWRIISPGQANVPHVFKPEALTAVIMGAQAKSSESLVAQLLEERHRRTGLVLPVYQVRHDDSTIRIDRVTL